MPIDKFNREIKEMIDNLDKFTYIHINDDWIGVDKERLKSIGNILVKNNIKWGACIRCSDLNEEIVRILENGNCVRLLLGVESGSDRILNVVIGKDYKEGIDSIKKAAIFLNNSKINATYSFIIGVPTETENDIKLSINLADWIHKNDKNSYISFNSYAPYPGTELYEIAKENGFKKFTTLKEWSKVTQSSEMMPFAENLYFISGLTFRGKKGDSTDKNFPGLKRLKILPFEFLARIRWRIKSFNHFNIEKFFIKRLIQKAVEERRMV